MAVIDPSRLGYPIQLEHPPSRRGGGPSMFFRVPKLLTKGGKETLGIGLFPPLHPSERMTHAELNSTFVSEVVVPGCAPGCFLHLNETLAPPRAYLGWSVLWVDGRPREIRV